MTELVARLRALDTCAVSDALDRHGLTGATAELRSMAADSTVAGRAVTVQLGPPSNGAAPTRHLGTAAVQAAGRDDVIVVAHQGRLDCAGWGGLLARAAARRGVEGVVVDGAARDLAEAADAGLPVFARAETPVTARGRAVETCWGGDVDVAGMHVRNGDLILGDRGGVVVVPAQHADAVLATAEQICATEAVMADAIDSGAPVSEVMGKTYEELTNGRY